MVVLTGLVGANFVQAVMDKLRLNDPIARGIATASRYGLQTFSVGKRMFSHGTVRSQIFQTSN